ncbi:MAG: hypothetical protein M1830_002103 [Pleopsidium flavum]|nr:MAG: hypothetical protein M1830_002103 [Pleopsidium flavum]
MVSLVVPKSGLVLDGATDVNVGSIKSGSKPTQVMRMILSEGMLDELMKSSRAGGKGMQLSFGKTPTLHYGNKTQQLTSAPEPLTHELYRTSSHNKDALTIAGIISHKLEIKKAEQVIAGADAALLALQSNLAAIDKEKQSKKTLFVADSSKLPPAKGAKRALAKPTNSMNFLKANHPRMFNNGTTQSMPTSPSLKPSQTPSLLPSALPPTSVPVLHNQKSGKLEALRTPLIHLLAIRSVSEKFLAQKTRCSQEECLEVLQKVGKPWRLDSSKWELSDRGYKDLDLWKFPYPSQDDRQMAIDNATKAFDRMRLSRADGLWQLLLPKEERGKGKVLSKLQLHAGPIQKSSTPRIHVQQTEESIVGGYATGDESDGRKGELVHSGGEDMVRSRSQDPIKKTRISEKEAQSKRLLSKNPKKSFQAVKAKETKPTEKKDTTNANIKVKSAEFVRDSDEDSEMEDVFTDKGRERQNHNDDAGATGGVDNARNISSGSGECANAIDSDEKNPKEIPSHRAKVVAVKPLLSTSSNSGSTHGLSDASQSSASDQNVKNGLTRPRNTSSPHKPSPLGSSPPTNASEFENDGQSYNASSSSSSPLILQTRKGTVTPTPNPTSPRPTSTITQRAETNLKHTLKRKADSIETDLPTSYNNSANAQQGPNKRHQSSAISPPTSDSSSASPITNYQTLMIAKRFKGYHAKYEKLYRELSNSPEPAQEQVKKVIDMHKRLTTMKMEIARAASVS